MTSPDGPISRVEVVSTGSVRLRPEHVGPTRRPMPVWAMTSTRWTEPRPINVFVIEHRDGIVVFDTGQDLASATDPGRYYPSRLDAFVTGRIGRLSLDADQTLEAGLARLRYRPDDVSTVVLSHLHQDHVGGLNQLRHARIVVSADEWALLDRPLPQMRGMYRSHIDLPGLAWERIAFEPLDEPSLLPFSRGHDLFGDASVVLLPTPGHTPGSLSMLVRPPGAAPLLMVGDLTYDVGLLDAGVPSGMCARGTTKATMARVNALRRAMPGLVILPAHDPGSAGRLRAAMTAPGAAR